jgi:hypothetical protein
MVMIVEERVTKVAQEPAGAMVTVMSMGRKVLPKARARARVAHMNPQGARRTREVMAVILTTGTEHSCVSHGAASWMDARRIVLINAPMLANGAVVPTVALTARKHPRSMEPWELQALTLVDRALRGARFRPQMW